MTISAELEAIAADLRAADPRNGLAVRLRLLAARLAAMEYRVMTYPAQLDREYLA